MARGSLPQNFQTDASTLYESFDTLGEWTAGGSAGSTISADTVNFEEGTAGLALNVVSTAGGNSFATKTISKSFANDYRFVLRVYVPDATTVNNVDLFLASTSGFTSFFKATMGGATGFTNGWNTIVFHRDDFAATGGEVWTNTMIRMRVRADAVASTLTTVIIDNLKLGGRHNATILFTFDDAFASVYTEAFPYMDARGLTGTIYVNGSSIDTAGYMTTAQLTEVRDAGWAICNHCYDHTNLTTLDATAQRASIANNIDWLGGRGFNDGKYDLAYPNGGYDESIITIAKNLGIKSARTVVEWSKRGQHFPVENLWKLKIGNCLNTTAASTITGWMADAYKKGAALILLYHKLVTTPTVSTEHAIADFQTEVTAAVRYKSQGLLTDKTIFQWRRGLTNARS